MLIQYKPVGDTSRPWADHRQGLKRSCKVPKCPSAHLVAWQWWLVSLVFVLNVKDEGDNCLVQLFSNQPEEDNGVIWWGYGMTKNRIILTKQSGRVTKILTASRILQISIALCQIKAKIHSFPTMYIIGGGKFGLTRWKKCLKPKRSPKNSCFGGNESQLHNFRQVWDPNFLRWPQFRGYPRKATCLSFKMSYVQGP